MTLHLLPVTEETAIQLLKIAAIIDFLIAILIFIPKLVKPVLLYAAFWGFITAFARIADGLSYDVSFSIVHQYLYTAVYRIPHGIVPLLLYYILKKK